MHNGRWKSKAIIYFTQRATAPRIGQCDRPGKRGSPSGYDRYLNGGAAAMRSVMDAEIFVSPDAIKAAFREELLEHFADSSISGLVRLEAELIAGSALARLLEHLRPSEGRFLDR